MATSVPAGTMPTIAEDDTGTHYAWYAVTVLTLAYVAAFVDRQILSLLVEPIRRDLAISDTQFSLLGGFAFALFYSVTGLMLGRLADRVHRGRLIAIGIFLWSAMTVVCGFACTFIELFLARMGVGIGEATLSPSAYSLIADHFPAQALGRAIGVFVMATSIGSGLALIIGGAVVGVVTAAPPLSLGPLGVVRAWQLAFILVGLPGVAIAVWVSTLKEPSRRGLMTGEGGRPVDVIPLRTVFTYFRSRADAYVPHFLGFSILGLFAFGALAWMPAFLIRRFGFSAREAGMALGLILLIGGTAGILAGGALGDWLRRRGYTDAYLRVPILTSIVLLPLSVVGPLLPNAAASLSCLAIASFCMFVPSAAAGAAIQTITPNQLRGQMTALYSCIGNLVGIALGPTAVALATDYVFKSDRAVGQSIALIGGIAIPLGAAILTLGLKPFRRYVAAAASWQSLNPVLPPPPPPRDTSC